MTFLAVLVSVLCIFEDDVPFLEVFVPDFALQPPNKRAVVRRRIDIRVVFCIISIPKDGFCRVYKADAAF